MAKIPNPFEATGHHNEWSARNVLVEWMNEIIRKKNLGIGPARGEKTLPDSKRPDILIYQKPQSKKVVCLIEMKQPYYDPFTDKESALRKANTSKSLYFATSNFKELVLFNTEKVNALKTEEEQIVEKYHLCSLNDLDLIENLQYKNSIIKGLENFLVDLYEISAKKKAEPQLPIDEFLIYRLQEKIKVLTHYYQDIIRGKVFGDPDFSKELQKWFADQNWTFLFQNQDFERAARQAAYLLTNKILFYNVLQCERPQDLDKLEIPQSLTKSDRLQYTLQGFFKNVLEIDYETIYDTDFIDQIAFPDNTEVVSEIKELVNILNRYDFSKLGYDIIGRIFEQLIPQKERRKLGQYFTSPDIVDLILKFCLRKEKDKVFDPGCGAGTFLVRAYQHKKLMNHRLTHEQILPTLWGNDIAKFPVHLATINLAIKDLGSSENYPRIIRKDFFEWLPGRVEAPDSWRKIILKGLGENGKAELVPRYFDCVVGNPPYTRQEEIAGVSGEDSVYKTQLIDRALQDLSGKKLANISRRAGIHAYFFVHGTKFLQNGGRFGFIVSNSWLDVDYGKGLQEFFLKNYKIITIVESKVERWFEDASINTCIIVLEKCSGQERKKQRDENLIRFVYLKRPLRHFIPATSSIWEKQVERIKKTDWLKKTILQHSDFYENEELRIYPKAQKELWDEGFDKKENKYVGSKWGKYLRAPEIFFKILEKGKNKLVPLKRVANVHFGIKTGANEFFYLTEEQIKKRKIEKEFWMHKEKGKWVPNYVVKSPRECKSIIIDPEDLKYRVLIIHKDREELKDTNILLYIKWGESKGFNKRPTCANRKRWWDLGGIRGDILCMMSVNERHIWWENKDQYFIDARLYGATIKSDKYKILGRTLNSTLFWLFTELWGRVNLGEGALDVKVYEYASMPVLKFDGKLKKLRQNKITQREINNVFEELGAKNIEDVSLDKVKPDRRELDKIVMGEILGLTNEEQLEAYKAVIDLVKSRITKAKSVEKKHKTKGGVDIDLLVKAVMEKVGKETLGKFYQEKIFSQKCYSKKLPKLSEDKEIRIDQTLMDWRLYSGKKYIECSSKERAKYCKIWLLAGLENIKIPHDNNYLKLILPKLEELFSKIKNIVDSYTSTIFDHKLKKQILSQLWREIVKH